MFHRLLTQNLEWILGFEFWGLGLGFAFAGFRVGLNSFARLCGLLKFSFIVVALRKLCGICFVNFYLNLSGLVAFGLFAFCQKPRAFILS